MKLNPLEWSEIANGKETQAPSGLLQLRGSAPFAVFFTTHGVESTQFVAAAARIVVPPETTFKVISDGRVFIKDRPSRVVFMTGEKFTNIDRLPTESGTMLEVTRALRMLKIEERAMVRRIREERDLAQSVIERAKPKPDPDPKPDPEPKSEPKPEPQSEPAK